MQILLLLALVYTCTVNAEWWKNGGEQCKDQGWCLTQYGLDLNVGQSELWVGGNVKMCLASCRSVDGATGCEFSKKAQICSVHTKEIGAGNGYSGTDCWIFSKCKGTKCKEQGWCLAPDYGDAKKQRKLTRGENPQQCLSRCREHPGATGCEYQTKSKTCTVHTGKLGSGSKKAGYDCWIFSKCKATTCRQRGWCLKEGGGDAPNGEGVEDKTAAQCLDWCKSRGAKGCEYHSASEYCSIHTGEIVGGNGRKGYACWIFSKCHEHNHLHRDPKTMKHRDVYRIRIQKREDSTLNHRINQGRNIDIPEEELEMK